MGAGGGRGRVAQRHAHEDRVGRRAYGLGFCRRRHLDTLLFSRKARFHLVCPVLVSKAKSHSSLELEEGYTRGLWSNEGHVSVKRHLLHDKETH